MEETPVISIAESCDLPDDESLKEELMQDLVKTFAEYGVSPDHFRLIDGDIYGQTNIHTKCPECHERLRLTGFELGPENGAHAAADCSCGWGGYAIYRLIDIHERDIDQKTKNNRTKLEPESCVANNMMNVTYASYIGGNRNKLSSDDM